MVRGTLFYLGLSAVDPWSYRFFPAELSLFLLGALANRWGLSTWQRLLADPAQQARASKLAVSALAILICIYSLLPLPETIKTVALMVLFVVLVPLAFLYQSRSGLDKRLGDLSYPIYIGHILMILFVGVVLRMLHWAPSALIQRMLNLLLSTGFAMILNKLLEQRVERIRDKMRHGRLPIWFRP
jgi:peptidoglycan/LPS O-acetylase OafA/YrhL